MNKGLGTTKKSIKICETDTRKCLEDKEGVDCLSSIYKRMHTPPSITFKNA